MATPLPSPFLMFVSGEPDTGADHLLVPTLSVAGRLASALVPIQFVSLATTGRPAGDIPPHDRSQDPAWHLPPAQVQCVNLVLEQAVRAGRKILLIDVNRSDAPAELVNRWVRPDDVFPLLIGPSGSRLEGEENFGSARAVRRFLQAA